MKHIGVLVCMAALLLSVLSGCGNTTETESGSENSVTSSASDTTTSNLLIEIIKPIMRRVKAYLFN